MTIDEEPLAHEVRNDAGDAIGMKCEGLWLAYLYGAFSVRIGSFGSSGFITKTARGGKPSFRFSQCERTASADPNPILYPNMELAGDAVAAAHEWREERRANGWRMP